MLKNMCDLNKPSQLGFSFKDHSQKKKFNGEAIQKYGNRRDFSRESSQGVLFQFVYKTPY